MKQFIKYSILFTILLIPAVGLKGQKKHASKKLKLQEFIKICINNNPIIQRLRYTYNSQRDLAKKAGSIKDLLSYISASYSHTSADPSFNYANGSNWNLQTSLSRKFPALLGATTQINLDYGVKTGDPLSSSTRPSLGFSLTFPLLYNFLGIIDKNALKNMHLSIKIINKTEKEAVEAFILQINKTYYEWILAVKKTDIYKGFMDRSQKIQQQTLRKRRFGIADPADSALAKYNYLNYRSQYLTAKMQSEIEYLKILSLMQGKSVSKISKNTLTDKGTKWSPGMIINSKTPVYRKINLIENFRTVQLARLQLESGRLNMQSSKNGKKPDLNLILGAYRESSTYPSSLQFNVLRRNNLYMGIEFSLSFQNTEKHYDAESSRNIYYQLKTQYSEFLINLVFILKKLSKSIEESQKILGIYSATSDTAKIRINAVYKKYTQGRARLKEVSDSVDIYAKSSITYLEQCILLKNLVLEYMALSDQLYNSRCFK